MQLRHFSGELESIASRWAEAAVTPDRWHVTGKAADQTKRADTESQPLIAQCGPISCVCKPGVDRGDNKPRAALEKIASDLAHHIGVAIAPVILLDRGNVAPAERYTCLSAWAFQPVFTWAEASAHLTPIELASSIPSITALVVYESWIAAQDRKPDHLLVSLPNTGSIPQINGIDYAFSLSESWAMENAPVTQWRMWRPDGVVLDQAVAQEAIKRIETVPQERIEEIVNRIPDSFLSQERKRIIIVNLLNRRGKMSQIYVP